MKLPFEKFYDTLECLGGGEMKKYGHPDFYKLTKQEEELHSKKNYQYANKKDPLGNFKRSSRLASKLIKDDINKPLAMAMILMAKQIDAVYDIVGESKKNTIESLEDKFRDISIYSKLCIILNKEK